jgi:hypothetical protein
MEYSNNKANIFTEVAGVAPTYFFMNLFQPLLIHSHGESNLGMLGATQVL